MTARVMTLSLFFRSWMLMPCGSGQPLIKLSTLRKKTDDTLRCAHNVKMQIQKHPSTLGTSSWNLHVFWVSYFHVIATVVTGSMRHWAVSVFLGIMWQKYQHQNILKYWKLKYWLCRMANFWITFIILLDYN